jgi:hypothetical protein
MRRPLRRGAPVHDETLNPPGDCGSLECRRDDFDEATHNV